MRKVKKDLKGLDLTVYTKNGTPRKRKPKTNRNYFTQETQNAIVKFCSMVEGRERDRLFSDKIYPSLDKLAETSINGNNFPYAKGVDGFESLKTELICFLYEKLNKYKEDAGKAYSYFYKIAFHFLVNYNNKQYDLQKDRKEMDAVDADKKVLQAGYEEIHNNDLFHFVQSFVQYVQDNIDGIHESVRYVKGEEIREYVTFSEQDKSIVEVVLFMLKNADEIEVFYKPALYLEIREKTGQKTLDITRVIKVLKCIMKQQMNIYYQNGSLDIDEGNIYIQR